jgi:hypothetical protein
MADEGHFSSASCDACGSHFAGDRYPSHVLDEPTDAWVHLDVCQDCLMYFANGDEPDEWLAGPWENK